MAQDALQTDDAQTETIDYLITEVQEAEKLGDTVFGKWFHVVRTTSPKHVDRVIVGVKITDDGVHASSVGKLTAGTWTPETQAQYDAVVSFSPRPFLSTDEARNIIVEDLIGQRRPPA